MEDWSEEKLSKLSVKELKPIARKSHVNPNLKKAELVKALLTCVKNDGQCIESENSQAARRVTRSRASIWQTSCETYMRDTHGEVNDEEKHMKFNFKNHVSDEKSKKKKVEVPNVEACDTSALFPLVSSIQINSKPLVEITNHEQGKQNESQTGVVTSIRSKRNKTHDKNFKEHLPSDTTEVQAPKSCFATEIGEQENDDLNNTFNVVEKKRSASQGSNRKSKELCHTLYNELQGLQLPVSKQSPNKTNDNSIRNEVKNENQEDSNLSNVAENNSKAKQKGGRKRKSDSPIENKRPGKDQDSNSANRSESLETRDTSETVNVHGPAKRRRKKIKKEDVKSVEKIAFDIENPTVQNELEIRDKVHETSDLMKRKMRNGSSAENSIYNCEVNDSGTDHKNKRSNGGLPLDNNVLASSEKTKVAKPGRNKNKKQAQPLGEDSSKTQVSPSVEASSTSYLSQSIGSRQSESLADSQNELLANFKENDLVNRSTTKIHNNSNGNIKGDEDSTAAQGETGEKTIPALTRSSTFVLSDSSVINSGEGGEMPVTAPRRNATFIVKDLVTQSPRRRSLRFSPGPAVAASPQYHGKLGKSIGHRIMKNAVKQGGENKLHAEPGSSVKKSIVKSTKSGSVFKKGSATKIPNFKKIHEQLFKNMESLGDNKQRQRQRAQQLLQSPVPRCALLSPKLGAIVTASKTPLQRNVVNTKVSTPEVASPLAAKLKSPLAAKLKSPLAAKLKTPMAPRTPMTASKPAPAAASINRFGFRNPVRKADAMNIAGKKMLAGHVEKNTEKMRGVLKGVRMNKRFMLQMQMRNIENNS